MTVWTIYMRQPVPWIAVKSTREGEPEHVMVSSDLIELRTRMVRLGLCQAPAHPIFDPPDIMEVWHDRS